ncbi:MAG TPA: hypothetical protein V6D30_05110, partial [Leptolyngbyaceae cyanobacterium]
RENSELAQDSVVTTESITPNVLPPTSDKTQDSFSASAQELGDSRGVIQGRGDTETRRRSESIQTGIETPTEYKPHIQEFDGGLQPLSQGRTKGSESPRVPASPTPRVFFDEIKDAAPNENVVNCPEIESSSQNKETVGMTAQETTQDTSPEPVLSCPEGSSLSDPTPVTGKEFKRKDVVALVADPTQIGEVLYFNPNWNEYNVALKAGMTNYYKPAELIKVVPRSGARIQYKVFTGELVSKVASGWHVRWEVSKSFKKRFGNPPAIVKESEFRLI